MTDAASDLVWYAGYGSNLSLARFGCYLRGGRPSGAARSYPGCRDRSEARDVASLVVRGRLRCAGESPVWGGGTAFFVPRVAGRVLMRAYLVSRSQLLDIADQEMHRPPGTLAGGRRLPGTWPASLALGDGRYETLHRVADLDGTPVIALSHATRDRRLPLNPPSARYLAQLILGLAQAHTIGPAEIACYLLSCDGIGWSATTLTELAEEVLGAQQEVLADDQRVPPRWGDTRRSAV